MNNLKSETKTIHFIGICGVAMSALAIAFHKKGWNVTGSDAGFYPPISTKLKDEKIDFYPGWHPEKMGNPDLVVVGNVAGSKNPEWLHVQENKIPYKSYPEAIAEYFVKENSIVCAGTYGKTTSTTLLSWILKENGFDPSYMFGGLSLNEMDSAHLSLRGASETSDAAISQEGKSEKETREIASPSARNDSWSILEGDEYKTSRWDTGAKFLHYSPTHLLLTSVVWDHADVYPTEESYVAAFQKLFDMIPQDGLRIVSEKAIEIIDTKDAQVISYGQDEQNDYRYTDVKQSKSGVSFTLTHKDTTYEIQSQMLGEFTADNITGCFALAHQIGIAPEKIIETVASFCGIKRRLEKRFEGRITVFDDIAHSPSKAEAILNSLKTVYDGNIIAVFEPNTGNRRPASIPGYDDAFTSADTVIIPRLTKLKVDPTDPDKPMDGQQLADVISKTHHDVRYIEKDEELVGLLTEKTKKDDVVVFLGSHGFRGMIESLITCLRQ